MKRESTLGITLRRAKVSGPVAEIDFIPARSSCAIIPREYPREAVPIGGTPMKPGYLLLGYF